MDANNSLFAHGLDARKDEVNLHKASVDPAQLGLGFGSTGDEVVLPEHPSFPLYPDYSFWQVDDATSRKTPMPWSQPDFSKDPMTIPLPTDCNLGSSPTRAVGSTKIASNEAAAEPKTRDEKVASAHDIQDKIWQLRAKEIQHQKEQMELQRQIAEMHRDMMLREDVQKSVEEIKKDSKSSEADAIPPYPGYPYPGMPPSSLYGMGMPPWGNPMMSHSYPAAGMMPPPWWASGFPPGMTGYPAYPHFDMPSPVSGGGNDDVAWPPPDAERKPSEKKKRDPTDASKPQTTVYWKNIPNNYRRDNLLKLINNQTNSKGEPLNFGLKYDFFYLPMDYQRKANRGFAFINFRSNKFALEFIEVFDKKSNLWDLKSDKISEVDWSDSQGWDDNIDRYRNSPVMHPDQEEGTKPVVFDANGMKTDFPAPTRRLRPPHQKECRAGAGGKPA